MHGLAGSTIAGVFSITAFVVALLSGVVAGNEPLSVVSRAFLALLLCYPIGFAVGLVLQRVIDDHIREHQERHPAPDSEAVLGGAGVEAAAPAEDDAILEV